MVQHLRARRADRADADAIARVHVTAWQEAYRGTLVSDDVLDSPDLLTSRKRFWAAALTDERWAENRVAVAETEDEGVIGVAMSGVLDGRAWSRQLYVLYVLEAHHGTGVGAALLDAVVDPAEAAALWVGDPVPRAQAFYRKHGFAFDGTSTIEDGNCEIRYVRLGASAHHR